MSSATLQQHQAAAKGHEHRSARGQTRRRLRDVADSAASRDECADLLLADLEPHMLTVEVFDLLTWIRGFGYDRPRRMLRRLDIPENQPLRLLTEAERRVLAGTLRHGYHDQLEMSA